MLTIFNLGYFQAKFLNVFQEKERQHIDCMDLAIKKFTGQDVEKTHLCAVVLFPSPFVIDISCNMALMAGLFC